MNLHSTVISPDIAAVDEYGVNNGRSSIRCDPRRKNPAEGFAKRVPVHILNTGIYVDRIGGSVFQLSIWPKSNGVVGNAKKTADHRIAFVFYCKGVAVDT